MIRILSLVAGYGFLLLGLIGLVLPFMQGILFMVVGLIILSQHTSWAGQVVSWLKARHPAMEKVIARAERLAGTGGRRIGDFVRRHLDRQVM